MSWRSPNARAAAGALRVALLVATLAPAAEASGGYFSGHKGARVAGRAGAFTARADDLSAVVYNPAGLGRLEEPTLQVGNRVSYNASEFTRASTLDWGHLEDGVPPRVDFATSRNQTPWQGLEPFVGFGTDLGLEDWRFALAAFAPSGIGRLRFPADGGQRYMMVRRNAQILVYSATVAYDVSERFSLGVSLQWVDVARLEYSLMIDATQFRGEVRPVWSELDMLATVSGADHFTPNAVVGALFRASPAIEVGLAAQVIPATIRTKSTLDVDPVAEDITEEVELRRGGRPADDVSLSLPLPLTARAGVRYVGRDDGEERFDVELDLVYETWSRVDRFRLDSDGLVANLLAQQLDIGVIDIEKEWQNSVGVHLGGDFAAVPDLLTLRGGVAYESAFADPAFSHVDFVSGTQLGGAVGASVLRGSLELAVAYGYQQALPVAVTEAEGRVFQEVPGSQCAPPYTDPDTCHPEYLGQPAPTVNGGEFRAHSHVASLDLLYRF